MKTLWYENPESCGTEQALWVRDDGSRPEPGEGADYICHPVEDGIYVRDRTSAIQWLEAIAGLDLEKVGDLEIREL